MDGSSSGSAPVVSTPFRVVAPRPISGSSASDIAHLHEAANWQEEQRRILSEQAEERRRLVLQMAEERERERQAIFEEHEAERQRLFDEAEDRRHADADARREEILRLAEERRYRVAEARDSARIAAEVAVEEVVAKADEDRERLQGEVSRLEEEVDAERVESRQRTGQLELTLQEERDRLLSEQQERIRVLEEQLQIQHEDCEAEKRHFEEIETERWEIQKNRDDERDNAVRAQLNEITAVLQDRAMETSRWRELDEERIAAAELRRAEKAAQSQELFDLVNTIIVDREEERRIREDERAAQAGKPGE